MEFLRSLLRRRFARAQVATSRNVDCFLRLPFKRKRYFSVVLFILMCKVVLTSETVDEILESTLFIKLQKLFLLSSL